MDWNVDAKESVFDASAATSATIAQRSDQRAGAGSSPHNYRTGLFGNTRDVSENAGSIVGMSMTEASNMVTAINEYTDAIMNYVKGIEPTANSDVAFKSDAVKTALVSYFEKVQEYCSNLVSDLKAFGDKVTDAKNQWEAATQEMASKVGGTASSFNTSTEYKSVNPQ